MHARDLCIAILSLSDALDCLRDGQIEPDDDVELSVSSLARATTTGKRSVCRGDKCSSALTSRAVYHLEQR
jgi:hypothetical protein